jgi:small membrane protein
MIAQALLSILLGLVLLHGWTQFRRSPLIAATSIVAGLAGLYLVWAPEQTTALAAFVGIGRGVDLILYLWVCISLNLLLSLHLKQRLQQETITNLARAFALAHPVVAPPDRLLTADDPPRLVPDVAHTSMQTRGQTV